MNINKNDIIKAVAKNIEKDIINDSYVFTTFEYDKDENGKSSINLSGMTSIDNLNEGDEYIFIKEGNGMNRIYSAIKGKMPITPLLFTTDTITFIPKNENDSENEQDDGIIPAFVKREASC